MFAFLLTLFFSVNAAEIIWSEEFNTLNTELWDYDTDYTRNNEAQCYTNNRQENVRVEKRGQDSVLVLEARKEKYVCEVLTARGRTFEYTSGAIRTRKRNAGPVLKDMRFGRYEIRAKIPAGRGTWPAIWMVGIAPGLNWPQAGEIDIMESVGWEQALGLNRLHSTLHKDPKGAPWPLARPGIGMGHVLDLKVPVDQDFHVYRLDWLPEKLSFYVDGVPVAERLISDRQTEYHPSFKKSEVRVRTPRDWPYGREIPGQQFFMLLNLAIGGSWGGRDGIDDKMFENGPVEMLVDYVRVYRLPGMK